MRVADEMISYRCPPEYRGYFELSSAIIESAVDDYRRLRKYASNTKECKRVRNFFLSEIFENISGCENPNVFLIKLDEQIDKEIEDGIKRKRKKQAMKCNG